MITPSVGDVPRELAHAMRALRRAPGFAVAVLLTLALGIGATSAVFTIFHAVVLMAPPYPEPDRLLILGANGDGIGSSQTGQFYLFLRDRLTTVEHVAAQRGTNGWNMRVNDSTTHVDGIQVSEEYFAAHATPPQLGRAFVRQETEPGGPNAVVISENLWRESFGARPDVLGQILELGEVPYTIVGVGPHGFRSIPAADVFTPLRTTPQDNSQNYRVLARLRDHRSIADATSEFAAVQGEVLRTFPRMNRLRLASTSWRRFGQALGERLQQPLLLVLGAVVCLLLIACFNTASLQLTRALANRREAITRAALGASPGRLIRHAAIESLFFAVAGAIAGIVVGIILTRLSLLFVSPQMLRDMTAGGPISVNAPVLAFTVSLSVLTTLVSGIVPAAIAARANARLATSTRASTPSRRAIWARRSLTLAEVALCTILLVGSGLLLRTIDNLRGVELGFDPNGVVVGRMSLQGAINPGQLESFLIAGVERVRQIPGVADVSVSNGVPIERALNVPFPAPPRSLVTMPSAVDLRYVTTDYFETLRIPLLAGRAFDAGDRVGRPVAVIVNDAFARAYFGRTNVVGETTAIGDIVGVVGNVKARSGTNWVRGATNALGSATAPEIFLAAGQAAALIGGGNRQTFDLTWAMRRSGSVGDLEREFRAAVSPLDGRAAILTVEPMADVIARDIDLERLVSLLLTAFAVLGALLAAVGLYGLTAHGAAQRTREIGVRMALGATTRRVVGHLVNEGVAVALGGLVLGLGGAALATSGLQRLLYGIQPLDPRTFAAATMVLVLLTAIAAGSPAARAARIDPVGALKES